MQLVLARIISCIFLVSSLPSVSPPYADSFWSDSVANK
nr:MAG TPA: hypothetical protein [Caudoviricetes sp.]